MNPAPHIVSHSVTAWPERQCFFVGGEPCTERTIGFSDFLHSENSSELGNPRYPRPPDTEREAERLSWQQQCRLLGAQRLLGALDDVAE